MTEPAPAPAVPQLLQQLARELTALQSMADEIEGSVAQLLGRQSAGLDHSGLQNLQLLDILNQSLRALSTFCANAASLAAPEWRIDVAAATSGITLAQLAQRLAGHGPGTGASSEDGCEMFTAR